MTKRSDSSLWFNADFMKLWTGQTLSLLGSQITLLALPLTAATLLEASATEMGLLAMFEYLPFLMVALFAGVWIDRQRRRPILIGADIGRAIILGLIPLIAWFGTLRMEYLYVIGFLAGILTTFYSIAYQAFLPTLVRREHLIEGNSKLELSRSISEIGGPGLAGVLVQLLTGPVAILLDAFSFLISAILSIFIQVKEPPPPPPDKNKDIWRDIGEGLQVVLKNRYLRRIAICSAILNLSYAVQVAIFVLYASRTLNISSIQLGIIFGFGSLGIPVGSMLTPIAVNRLGTGQAMIIALFIASLGFMLVPLASGSVAVASSVLIGAQFLITLAMTLYNINQNSLRQTITPEHLLGRMSASMRFIVWGAIPIGSLLGGALGDMIGLRQTMIVGALGVFCAFLAIFFSPLRTLGQPSEQMPLRESEVGSD